MLVRPLLLVKLSVGNHGAVVFSASTICRVFLMRRPAYPWRLSEKFSGQTTYSPVPPQHEFQNAGSFFAYRKPKDNRLSLPLGSPAGSETHDFLGRILPCSMLQIGCGNNMRKCIILPIEKFPWVFLFGLHPYTFHMPHDILHTEKLSGSFGETKLPEDRPMIPIFCRDAFSENRMLLQTFTASFCSLHRHESASDFIISE